MVEKKGLDHVLSEFKCFDSVILCKERTCCSKNIEGRYCIGHGGQHFCMDYKFKGEGVITTLEGNFSIRVTLSNMVAVSNLVTRTKSAVLGYKP